MSPEFVEGANGAVRWDYNEANQNLNNHELP
jgi:hypothetical protein